MQDYLPDGKEIWKIPKQWIANVCATILKNSFSDWVLRMVDKRNQELLEDKGMEIEMDPEITRAFQASTKTSGR